MSNVQTIHLPKENVLTVTPDAYAAGNIVRIYSGSDPTDFYTLIPSTVKTYGPFNDERDYSVTNTAGSCTVSVGFQGTEAPDLGTASALDVDTDDTLDADSDSVIPSQKAVKAYVDNSIGGNLVDDTTPQLGGDLDLNGHVITGLADVAYSGDYTDLVNSPTLADVATSGDYTDLINSPALETVATSGLYTDLTITPEANVDTIANDATGTQIATAVNAIIAALIAKGLMSAP